MAANVNSYISAGNAAVENAYQSLAAARDNSPKHGELARKGMRARANESMAAMKADAKVGVAKDKAKAHVKQYDIAAEGAKKVRDIKKGQQMAGKLASAAGMIALSAMPGPEQIKPRTTDYSRSEAMFRERLGQAEKDIEKFSNPDYKSDLDKEFESLNAGSAAITQTSSGKPAPATTDFGNTNITSNDRDILNLLGKYESGTSGYDAVNQIGVAGGHGTLGHSGSIRDMQQHGGRPLTDFTVGEIMDLQADDRTRSDQQWIDEGRLHAVGRYQFIGPTFASAVQRQGLSRDTKFTPEVQDQMALTHLRGAGSLQPWVGPHTHATSAERSMANNWFANQ